MLQIMSRLLLFQSLNYDVCENVLYLKDQEKYKSKVCDLNVHCFSVYINKLINSSNMN